MRRLPFLTRHFPFLTRRLPFLVLLGVALGLLPGIASSSEVVPTINARSPYSWSPNAAEVKPGGSVTFQNSNEGRHGIIWESGDPETPNCSGVPINLGEASWHGSCSFAKPGVYRFECAVHRSLMTGEITVSAGGTTTSTSTSTSTTTSSSTTTTTYTYPTTTTTSSSTTTTLTQPISSTSSATPPPTAAPTTPTPPTTTTSPTTPKPAGAGAHLTRAQKLALALKACRKKHGAKRAACQRAARRRYGAKRK